MPINSFIPPEAAPNAEILVEEDVEEGGNFLHVTSSLVGTQSGDLRPVIGDGCGLKISAIGGDPYFSKLVATHGCIVPAFCSLCNFRGSNSRRVKSGLGGHSAKILNNHDQPTTTGGGQRNFTFSKVRNTVTTRINIGFFDLAKISMKSCNRQPRMVNPSMRVADPLPLIRFC